MKDTLLRLLGIALLAILVIILWKACWKKEKELVQKEQVISYKDTIIYRYRDAVGREHAQKQVVYTNNVALIAERDSLIEILKVKDDRIEELTAFNTTRPGKAKVETKVITIETDSGKSDSSAREFTFRDKWLDLHGVSAIDYTTIDYQFNDSLNIATFYKKNWLLGKKRLYVDVFSSVPNTTIGGLQNYRREIKQPGRLGIGPFVGATWDGQWHPTYGIGISYQLIRF